MPTKRILCAIDFSPSSHDALNAAAELARSSHAALVLVHAVERPLWVREPPVHLPGDVREQSFVQVETELEQWKQEALRCGVQEVLTKVASGGVVWELIDQVARQDPSIELVVVGTHGRTGLERAFLGSVAERIVRHAPCSVMVVRPKQAATA